MIHNLLLDDDIEDRLKEFNDRLPADEKIVHMTTSAKYLFVTTEKKEPSSSSKISNLLLDEFKRGPTR